ncbi:MAG: methyltransferase domain-containing protein [Caldilineaceae bacterium]|jgi:SAM-dependent methyltransferase|nr:methyltransferase domain-containing protein [Caldilineaceae bacterium]
MTAPLSQNIAENIQNDKYLQERTAPRPGDLGFYLHLSDLKLALDSIATDRRILVLDYGSGGSPYRHLFANAEYRRADFREFKDIDYIINESGGVEESPNTFDLILSTQVVEHVENPHLYFAECRRLLKPGGKLVLTTHGSFEDHGCPYDYQRWTVYGLHRDLEKAGFEIESSSKLTTGPRAVLFFIERGWLRTPKFSILGSLFLVIRSILKLVRPFYHRLCDRELSQYRVVSSNLDDHALYIAVFVVACKPFC